MMLRDHDQPCEHEATEKWRHIDHYTTRGHSTPDGWCPGGREITYEVVPWCTKHNGEWLVSGKCWKGRGYPTVCQKEDPPRHIVMLDWARNTALGVNQ
jgi:hypothetical protein